MGPGFVEKIWKDGKISKVVLTTNFRMIEYYLGQLEYYDTNREGQLWIKSRKCALDIEVYRLYRFNRLCLWYQICKNYGVCKDIRNMVIRQYLLFDFYEGCASTYVSNLTELQRFNLFQTCYIDPSIARKLLNVPYKTIHERYKWVAGHGIIHLPLIMVSGLIGGKPLVFLYIIGMVCLYVKQMIQSTPTFLQ